MEKNKLRFGKHLRLSEKNAIFLTLKEETREAMLNVDIEKLTEKTGGNDLMAELDKRFLKDESSQA